MCFLDLQKKTEKLSMLEQKRTFLESALNSAQGYTNILSHFRHEIFYCRSEIKNQYYGNNCSSYILFENLPSSEKYDEN